MAKAAAKAGKKGTSKAVKAVQEPVVTLEKKDVIANFRTHETDTGSTEVQVAILTSRINHLIEHLKTHKKDEHTRYGLLLMVGRRRRLLRYLQRTEYPRFVKLAKSLGLKIAA